MSYIGKPFLNDDYQIKVMGDKATVIISYDKAWKYPEGKYNKVIGNVDGVSGATQSWTEGKGNLINFNHLEPTRQALEDFKSSIINNTVPLSNLKSGAASGPQTTVIEIFLFLFIR